MNDYVTEAELLALGVEMPRKPVAPVIAWPAWYKSQTINKLVKPGQKQDPIYLKPKVVDALLLAGVDDLEVNDILAKAEAVRILETFPGNVASSCVNAVLGTMSTVLKNVQLKRLKRVTTEEVATLMAQMNAAIDHIHKQENRIEELEAQAKMDANERQFNDLINAIGEDTACMEDLADVLCDEQPLSPSSPPPSSPPLTHAQAIALAFGKEMFTDGYFS